MNLLITKIFIPEKARKGFGGGWSFIGNLVKALKNDVKFVDRISECDIYFIPGPTLAERDEVKVAKSMGKKIVLRVDNIVRNSRNRGTGMSRLYDFAQMADVIIYQSVWARDLLMPFLKKDGKIILNGADIDVFNKDDKKIEKDGSPQFLYVRSSRDELKRWEKAYYDFQREYFRNPNAHLWIVGNFSPENIEYDFDFFGGAEKRYKFWGIISDRKQLAEIYRSADILLLPFFSDACSNTATEARLCGLRIKYDEMEGGGTNEIMNVLEEELTIQAMGKRYLQVFKSVL